MKKTIIQIKNLTKDYGHGRGVFDISFQIREGECYGFLGSNGAGKTTAIRHLMGFSKPQKGCCSILGKDCWKESAQLKPKVGYLPGEIAFPSGMTGTAFLNMMMHMRKMKDRVYCRHLLERFELTPSLKIDEMSLGMRRKLAVVTAFMHDPGILILDEPTSGLDPIMQQIFIEYIHDEKKRGKTILLSSHIFHEVDAVCDSIAVIKNGYIVSEFVVDGLKESNDSIYRLTFRTAEDYRRFLTLPYRMHENEKNLSVRVLVNKEELAVFLRVAADMKPKGFREMPFTMEDYFMGFYQSEKTSGR